MPIPKDVTTIAGAGFEPATSGLWARRATRLLYPAAIILLIKFSVIRRLTVFALQETHTTKRHNSIKQTYYQGL